MPPIKQHNILQLLPSLQQAEINKIKLNCISAAVIHIQLKKEFDILWSMWLFYCLDDLS